VSELAVLARAFEAVPEPEEATVAAARAALLRRIGERRPARRLHLALVAIAVFLALAGIATATYVGVRSWVSSSPRGIQHAADYRLARIFAPSDAREQAANFVRNRFWSAFALDPRGHDLYALHDRARARLPELVRIASVDRGARHTATPVLDLRTLAGPGFHPAGGRQAGRDAVAVAPGGDVFLLVWGRDALSLVRPGGGDATVFVLHPNGATQRVVSLGDLVGAKAIPDRSGETILRLAATARDRIWLEALAMTPEHRNTRYAVVRLAEIVDPNADGDWSDRVVRPVALPRSVPVGGSGRWIWNQLLADGPRSVLATAWSLESRLRVYRIGDFDDDGDALDPGEVEVAFAHEGDEAVVARVTGRALAFAGLRFNRISLSSGSGAVRDVARSFPAYFDAVLAGPDGAIYPVTEAGIVYRLSPAVGTRPTGTVVQSRVRAPALPPAGGVAQILFSTPAPASVGLKDIQGPLYAVGADGRGLRELPDGAAQCFSADGRMIAFLSDAEAPYEYSAYVANTDGSAIRKLPANTGYRCPFATPVMWLDTPRGLVRYDLRSHREIGSPRSLPELVTSPDGRRGAYLERRGPLVVVDLATQRRHSLGPPVPTGPKGVDREYSMIGLAWSPDGRRLAYVTTRKSRSTVWVRDSSTGKLLLSRSVAGSTPHISWSPDGASLLMCVDDRPEPYGYFSCNGGPPVPPGKAQPQPPAQLLLITIRDGSTRTVARQPLVFADWSPSGDTLAYATPKALYLRTRDGRTRRVAAARRGRWPAGPWLGWSPDGRYIGISSYGLGARWKLGPLMTIDVRTGHVRVIPTPARSGWATWWHR
jgi:hypothetical protein